MVGGKRIISVLVLGAIAVVVGTIFAWRPSAKYSNCDHKILREFRSSNGRSVAVVMKTNCGATTPFTVAAGIRKEAHFDFDRDIFFSIRGNENIEIVWRDSPMLDVTHTEPILTVVYDKPDLIYRQAIVWNTERISYRER